MHELAIHDSARRHAVSDEDIRHAVRSALLVAAIDEHLAPHRSLVLGPDRAANMLELVVLRFDDGHNLVIHAMPARRRYLQMLAPPDDFSA